MNVNSKADMHHEFMIDVCFSTDVVFLYSQSLIEHYSQNEGFFYSERYFATCMANDRSQQTVFVSCVFAYNDSARTRA